jgi:hypothetical protein
VHGAPLGETLVGSWQPVSASKPSPVKTYSENPSLSTNTRPAPPAPELPLLITTAHQPPPSESVEGRAAACATSHDYPSVRVLSALVRPVAGCAPAKGRSDENRPP